MASKIFRSSSFVLLLLLVIASNEIYAQVNFVVANNLRFNVGSNLKFGVAGNLVTNSGGTFTIASASEVIVDGSITNNGSQSWTGGILTLSSSISPVNIEGNPIAVPSMTINKSNSLNVVNFSMSSMTATNFNLLRGFLRYDNSSSRTFEAIEDLNIATNGTLEVNTVGTQTHFLVTQKSINQDGNIDFNKTAAKCILYSYSSNSSTLSGSGTLSNYYRVTLNKASSSSFTLNKLISLDNPFLDLRSGVFSIIGNYSLANQFFFANSGFYRIPANSTFHINNPNVIVNDQDARCELLGSLIISSGTYNIGSGSSTATLEYDDNSTLRVDGGLLNVNRNLARISTNNTAKINFSQTSGTISVGNARSNLTNRGVFDVGATGSTFSQTGGSIVIKQNSSAFTNDYLNLASSHTNTGGSLYLIPNVNTDPESNFRINSSNPLHNVFVIDDNGSRNPQLEYLTTSPTITNNLTIAKRGLVLNNLNLNVSGTFINNTSNSGTINQGTGVINFIGGNNQLIGGTQTTTFGLVDFNKPSGTISLQKSIKFTNLSRFIGFTVIEQGDNDVYSLSTTTFSSSTLSSDVAFDESKCILQNSSSLSGRFYLEFAPSATFPIIYTLPIGNKSGTASNHYYAGTEIQFNNNSATFTPTSRIMIKAVGSEHPDVVLSNISLKKYWIIKKENLTLNTNMALRLAYNVNEVVGSEGNFKVLYYSPSYPDTLGFWKVEPGLNNDVVEFNLKKIISDAMPNIDGDWTAGEKNAAIATYYSRQDGEFNKDSTWSKIGFGGPKSNTVPGKISDQIFIKDHTVTVSTNIPSYNICTVEENGTLKFLGNKFTQGDTLRVMANGKIDISDSIGISSAGATGNVRTVVRDYDPGAIFIYSGTTTNQIPGTGLPSIIKGLVVNKTGNNKLTLGSLVQISDSLVINDGVLDLDSYSANGTTPGRTFRMRGGELQIRNTFPANYIPPTLTSGTVTFLGASNNVTIPSSASTPGVAQYNNIKVSGTYTGDVVFATDPNNSGQIRIAKDFSISEAYFSGSINTRFQTSGSTVVFNGSSGTQTIQNRPQFPNDPISFLNYENLILDSASVKIISNPSGTTNLIVNGNLDLRNSATFDPLTNNIEINGNWTNSGTNTTFIPRTSTVSVSSLIQNVVKTISTRNINDNPFYNLNILSQIGTGKGIVEIENDTRVLGNLNVSNTATLQINNAKLELLGNLNLDNNSIYLTNTSSTLALLGNTSQSITTNNNNLNLRTLVVSNTVGVNAQGISTSQNNGIIVNDVLRLEGGAINVRGRQLTALGSVQRPGANPGYVDGALRKTIPAGSSTVTYEVGYLRSYTPTTLVFNGSTGTEGSLELIADTITTTSTTITHDVSNVLPSGSSLDNAKHLRRQWRAVIPSGSAFALGTRDYDATLNFIPGNSPSGDLRGSANSLLFEGRLWTGSAWVSPNLTAPITGLRTANSYEFKKLSNLGALTIGEPQLLTFYSRGSGSFTDPNVWSTQSHSGTTSNVAPTTNTSFNVFIAESHSITLNNDYIVNSPGFVRVDSTGILIFNDRVLSGSGTFLLNQAGQVTTQNTNGFRQTGALGSVQTTGRFYNGATNHNRSRFFFNAASNNITQDNSLPTTVAWLRTDMGSNTFSLSSPITYTDSLCIQSGYFLTNANQNLFNKLGIYSGTFDSFTNSNTITFNGVQNQDVQAYSSLTFHTLQLNNSFSEGKVQFLNQGSGTIAKNIQINNSLIFASSNQARIDLSTPLVTSSSLTNFPDYNNGEWFMTIANAATVQRTGLGHIDGELIKNIPIGTQAINFEIGDSTEYRPVTFRLTGSGGGEVAGPVGIMNIKRLHPYGLELEESATISIPSNRQIANYWRITRPESSSFTKGTSRTISLIVNYVPSVDQPPVASPNCYDVTWWYGSSSMNWQRNSPPSNIFNYGGVSGCGERDITFNEAVYTLGSSASFTRVDLNSSAVDYGNTNLLISTNNRFLLADVVVGQQGSQPIRYYSIANGNWTDPNVWSTVSYSSTFNETSSFPKRRSDVAKIGNSKTVTLDCNLGGVFLGTQNTPGWAEQRIGTVRVENTNGNPGTLLMGNFNIRTNLFELESGCTLETTLYEGFTSAQNFGNLIHQQGGIGLNINKTYNFDGHNNGNFIVRPSGTITDFRNRSNTYYCQPSVSNGTISIVNVQLNQGTSFSSPTFTNPTGADNAGRRVFPDRVMYVEPSKTYNLRVNTNAASMVRAWFDWGFNGVFDATATEQTSAVNTTGNLVDFQIAVPAGTPNGVTFARIGIRTTGTAPSNCTTGGPSGDYEDYTVVVVNPSWNPTNEAVTGDGIPAIINSLSYNAATSTRVIRQSVAHNIISNLTVTNGIYVDANSSTFQGNINNNAGNNNYHNSGTVTFASSTINQNIQGSFSSSFGSIVLQKPSGNLVLSQPVTIDNLLRFNSNNLLDMGTNSITFGQNANFIQSSTGDFSANRMILMTGSTITSGTIFKLFNNSNGAKSFNLPYGVTGSYNPATFSLTAASATGSQLSVSSRLINALHPNRITGATNKLNKYWQLNATGFQTSISTNSLSFSYNLADIGGNQNRYIASEYGYGSNSWEIVLGTNPTGRPSPISITNAPTPLGDWTAGESSAFFPGASYFSRASGSWSVPSNWSNVNHTGPNSSYYPGEVSEGDNVFIDNNNSITYNVASASISTLQIDGSLGGNTSGSFIWSPTPLYKHLTISNTLSIGPSGFIVGSTPGGRRDTLSIGVGILNSSTISNAVNFAPNSSNLTDIYFISSSNTASTFSTISGTGLWGSLAKVFLNKNNGLSDVLKISSSNFAASTNSSSFYSFQFKKGVLLLEDNLNLSLSNDNSLVQMDPFTGIRQSTGTITTSNGLNSSVNTIFNLTGGLFRVGNAIDESFGYQAGTSLTFSSNTFETASAFYPLNTSADINLLLTNSPYLLLNTQGLTVTNRNIFDLNKTSNTFIQNSGTITLQRPAPGTFAWNVKASGAGTTISGGVLQLGNTASPTLSSFRVTGDTPINDLNVIGTSQIGEISQNPFRVRGNCLVASSNTLQLRGTTLELGGNLTINGFFDPFTGAAISDLKQLTLNGNGNQTIFNSLGSGLELFNLTLQKPSGTVTLSSLGNSDLIIRATLDFANSNNAIIDASSNSFSRTVRLVPNGSSINISRTGQGHVYGRLRRQIGSNASSNLFTVGGPTVAEYRPALITTVGNGGTAGELGVVLYNLEHPKIDFNFLDTAKSIRKYWNIKTNGFVLGVNQTFRLSLGFVNPADLRNGAGTAFFDTFRWNPECPNPPSGCPGSGTWTTLESDGKLTTTTLSKNNTLFGDFTISEAAGLTYYSIASGQWNDVNTWSNQGYNGVVAPDYPRLGSDIVRIGNNRKVTVSQFFTPTPVRSVFVERFNGNPGDLFIEGTSQALNGTNFVVEDSCILSIQALNGIAEGTAAGAIRFPSKTLGKARYIFSVPNGSMNLGTAFPDSVASLTLDFPGALNNSSLFISDTPLKSIFIKDTLRINRGVLSPKFQRPLHINNQLIINNNGRFDSSQVSILAFVGSSSKTVSLGGPSGIRVSQIEIRDSGNVHLIRPTGGQTALYNNMVALDTMIFFGTGRVNTRQSDRKLLLQENVNINRVNSNSGYVDGTISKLLSGSSTATFRYETGFSNTYSPVILSLSNGSGTTGYLDVTVNSPYADEPFNGNRLDPARKINRYWTIAAPTSNSFTLGTRRPSTTFQLNTGEIPLASVPDYLIRRFNSTETYTWTERKGSQLSWASNTLVGTVGTSNTWDGLGDFYIGAKAKRVFYSVASGSWNQNSIWAFDATGTIPVPAGVFPNNDWQNPSGFELEVRDSVVLQNSNTVTLNTQPELSYLQIGGNSKLIVDGATNFIRRSSIGVSALDFNNGFFENKTALGIETDTSNSILRFAPGTSNYSNTFNYIFSGNVAQKFGTGFPSTIGGLIISNTGSGTASIVATNSNTLTLNSDLIINSGLLRPESNSFTLNTKSNIQSATALDFTLSPTGSPVCAPLIFSGGGTNNQVLSGSGGIVACSIFMDRTAGTGVVLNNTSTTVTNLFDFNLTNSTQNQIFEIGSSSLTLANSNPSILVDYTTSNTSPYRYFRTSATGSYLNFLVASNQDYILPLGTIKNGVNELSSATYDAGSTGTTGYLGLKAALGSNPSATYAHLYMSPVAPAYIGRFFSVNNVTTSVPGLLTFQYLDTDIFGTESNSDRIGQYGNPSEGASATWTLHNSASFNHTSNQFTSSTITNPLLLVGDWALANLNSFKRLFYSRQTGLFNDPNSWTANSSHTGVIFGTGLFPSLIQDSVVIGGGNNGINNHIISLSANTATISGITLGTSTTNTGTLKTNDFTANALFVQMNPRSTIDIGNSIGLNTSATVGGYGAIAAYNSSTFNSDGFYIYSGTASQVTGNGLPSSIRGLIVRNTSTISSEDLTLTNSLTVSNTVSLEIGRLNLGINALNSSGSATFNQFNNTKLRLGGTSNLLSSLNNFNNYTLGSSSTIDFYGTAQTISSLPTNLTNGLQFVELNNNGNKLVSSPLLIRRNLSINNGATLLNQVGVNSLQVLGSIINTNSTFNNGGTIFIGN
jgi:hypothetical protein